MVPRSRTGLLAFVSLVLATVPPLVDRHVRAETRRPGAALAGGWSDSSLGAELQLPEVRVFERADGRLGLRIRTNLGLSGGGDLRVVSFLNKQDRSFRIFVLDDPAVDSVRIHDYLEALGVHISKEALLHGLVVRERRYAERVRRSDSRPKQFFPRSVTPTLEQEADEEAPSNLEPEGSCSGELWADSQTWEPAKYLFPVDELTDTLIDATFLVDASSQWAYVWDHYCWSNPETFAFTSWFTSSCFAGVYSDYGILEYYQSGDYYNYDFAGDAQAAYVSAGVSVGWSWWWGFYTDHYYEEDPFNHPFENILLSEHYEYHNGTHCWWTQPSPVKSRK